MRWSNCHGADGSHYSTDFGHTRGYNMTTAVYNDDLVTDCDSRSLDLPPLTRSYK